MLDIGWSELLVIGVVALVVVGPKDLPKLMREVGKLTARARGMARQFRSGWDSMVQEAELDEFRKQAESAAMAASAGMKAATDPVRGIPELLSLDELAEPSRPAPPPVGAPAAALLPNAAPVAAKPDEAKP
jgi:sec-independent protein translocase protein TatB